MSTRCSQKNKERLQKEALARYQNLSKKQKQKVSVHAEKCQNLSEEEKEKIHQDHHECHKNLSEDEKQRISEC